uniref:Uncharacterized protein n=1 Tax=Parastrongyloides trichosuri TaxID=131310 RepID=A0A0N4ZGS6_PARTI
MVLKKLTFLTLLSIFCLSLCLDAVNQNTTTGKPSRKGNRVKRHHPPGPPEDWFWGYGYPFYDYPYYNYYNFGWGYPYYMPQWGYDILRPPPPPRRPHHHHHFHAPDYPNFPPHDDHPGRPEPRDFFKE